ncbi:uncharacterized protein SPAPADRAFT_58496 [Spathaspora passalidarum NRRL Y-27907]|uniref:C2H2-type domain-containing protein n=1 Tax=Spathaspora passalidarum (strain NRRL Y-27907 / 11-Y1) TaxID=619300 RepID=G3AGD9_SPAPN|nr:uncharacterized protein SPAPADRAFT_58496 [Spathaspora passalidarum NRRL Y-27907]EGW35278.1 hypothetical protein SPAPADRAFT_58496 [Spathaspora passalidarum NRRL Y-27907]
MFTYSDFQGDAHFHITSLGLDATIPQQLASSPNQPADNVVFKQSYTQDVFLNDNSIITGPHSLINSANNSTTSTTTTTPSVSYPFNDMIDLQVKFDNILGNDFITNPKPFLEDTTLNSYHTTTNSQNITDSTNTINTINNTNNKATVTPGDYNSAGQSISTTPVSPVPFVVFDQKQQDDYLSYNEQYLFEQPSQITVSQPQQPVSQAPIQHTHSLIDFHDGYYNELPNLHSHNHIHNHESAYINHYSTDPTTPVSNEFDLSPKQTTHTLQRPLPHTSMSYPDLSTMRNRTSVVLASQSVEHSPRLQRQESAFDVRAAVGSTSIFNLGGGADSKLVLNTSPRTVGHSHNHNHSHNHRLHHHLHRQSPPKPIKPELLSKFSEEQIRSIKLAETDAKCRNHCNASFANYMQLIDHFEEFKLSSFEFRGFKCPVHECPMSIIGYDKKADLRHHVVIDHFKKGKVIDECCQYSSELKSIIYVCNDDNCGKGFYRRDSLTRHIKLVHNGEPNVFNQKKKLENAEKKRKRKSIAK